MYRQQIALVLLTFMLKRHLASHSIVQFSRTTQYSLIQYQHLVCIMMIQQQVQKPII